MAAPKKRIFSAVLSVSFLDGEIQSIGRFEVRRRLGVPTGYAKAVFTCATDSAPSLRDALPPRGCQNELRDARSLTIGLVGSRNGIRACGREFPEFPFLADNFEIVTNIDFAAHDMFRTFPARFRCSFKHHLASLTGARDNVGGFAEVRRQLVGFVEVRIR